MSYEKHKFEVILFDESCIFTDLEVSGGPEGGIVVNSINPNASDR